MAKAIHAHTIKSTKPKFHVVGHAHVCNVYEADSPEEAVRLFNKEFDGMEIDADGVNEAEGERGWSVVGYCKSCGKAILEGKPYSCDGENFTCGACSSVHNN